MVTLCLFAEGKAVAAVCRKCPLQEERLHPPASPGCRAPAGKGGRSQGCSWARDTKKQERFQVTSVAHSHLSAPSSSHRASLFCTDSVRQQHRAATCLCETESKAINERPSFLPIRPGSCSSNQLPGTPNQALRDPRRQLRALPGHPGAAGSAAAPAPTAARTRCSTRSNRVTFNV